MAVHASDKRSRQAIQELQEEILLGGSTSDPLSPIDELSTTDEPSTTDEYGSGGDEDETKEAESQLSSTRSSSKQKTETQTFYLHRGDFRSADLIEQAGGFTAKYNGFVRVILYENDHMEDKTFQFLHKLLQPKPLHWTRSQTNMNVSAEANDILKRIQKHANELKTGEYFGYLDVHINNDYTPPKDEKRKIVGVLEALPLAFDTVLKEKINIKLDALREDKERYLVEDCIQGNDENAKKQMAYQNFFNILRKRSLTSVAMGHQASNWPEFISTGNSQANGDIKGDEEYDIEIEVREVTDQLPISLIRRRQEKCTVWINADAENINDADVLLFTNYNRQHKQNVEMDFVYKIPYKYIKPRKIDITQQ
jgi:hypothetical protein